MKSSSMVHKRYFRVKLFSNPSTILHTLLDVLKLLAIATPTYALGSESPKAALKLVVLLQLGGCVCEDS